MRLLFSHIIFFLLMILLSNTMIYGQGIEIPRASPKATVSQTIGVCTVSVIYGRPSAHGRKVMGALVPYGEVWRAGANEATVMSFNYPVNIGGKYVPAGKYGLFMVPQEEKWTVILNRDWSQWGAYNYDAGDDVLRIELIPQNIDHTELCTYSFTEVNKSKGVLNLEWENVRIVINIETDTHGQTLSEIEKAVSSSRENWYIFSAAAQYHFYEQKESAKALEYIDMAIALKAPNPAPWMLKSQILAGEGQYKEAINLAQEAIEVCNKHNFLFEVEENNENIVTWTDLLKIN